LQGWTQVDGGTVYYDENGDRLIGFQWLYLAPYWGAFYFHSGTGIMENGGFFTAYGVLFGPGGTGPNNDEWWAHRGYFAHEDGRLARDAWFSWTDHLGNVFGFLANADGIFYTDTWIIYPGNDEVYRFNVNGTVPEGWFEYLGNWYHTRLGVGYVLRAIHGPVYIDGAYREFYDSGIYTGGNPFA
jgi:glucan-binding YG repeat protein